MIRHHLHQKMLPLKKKHTISKHLLHLNKVHAIQGTNKTINIPATCLRSQLSRAMLAITSGRRPLPSYVHDIYSEYSQHIHCMYSPFSSFHIPYINMTYHLTTILTQLVTQNASLAVLFAGIYVVRPYRR